MTLHQRILSGLFLLLSFLVSNNSSGQQFAWGKQLTSGSGHDTVTAIVADTFGYIYVAGKFSGQPDFDPGPGIAQLAAAGSLGNTDVFIAKLGPAGNLLWVKRIGNSFVEEATHIFADPAGNVIVAGRYRDSVDFDPDTSAAFKYSSAQEVFLLRLDPDGNYVNAITLPYYSPGSVGRVHVAMDVSGSLYVSGFISGLQDFDPGPGLGILSGTASFFGGAGLYVAKYTSALTYAWGLSLENVWVWDGSVMKTDSFGNVYVAGTFGDTTDFDPNGIYNLAPIGGVPNIFVWKLTPAGTMLWARQLPVLSHSGALWDAAVDIEANSSGVWLVGYGDAAMTDLDPGPGSHIFGGPGIQRFLLKMDAAGSFMWAKSFTEWNIALDDTGNLLIAASFTATKDLDPGPGIFNLPAAFGGTDACVIKLDDTGKFLSAYPVSGTTSPGEAVTALAFDHKGGYYFAGTFGGTTDLDPGASSANATALGGQDAFVIKLGHCTQPPVLGPIGGGQAVCPGMAVSFYATTSPDINAYVWTFPAGWSGTPNGNMLTVTPTTTPGAITVYALSNCGISTVQTLSLSIAAAPAVPVLSMSGPVSICQGDSLLITQNAVAGVNYQWQFNGTTVATGPGPYKANTAGSYTLVASIGACISISLPLIVTVHPLPVVTISQSGNTLTSTGIFSSYQWYWNGSPVAGATGPILSTVSIGSYYLRVTDANGCSSFSNTVIVTGVEGTEQQDGVLIYPNPTDGIVHIRSIAAPDELIVSDVLGKLVYSTKTPAKELYFTLPGRGCYFVQLRFGKYIRTEKLVVY